MIFGILNNATKALVFGNLFKLFRLAITFAREFYCLGIKMKTNMTIVLFFSLSPTANCPCECAGKRSRINYQIQGFSLQLKNGWLEVLELVALFLFKTGTCDAKNSSQFFVDAIFCFVTICVQKRWTNTK